MHACYSSEEQLTVSDCSSSCHPAQPCWGIEIIALTVQSILLSVREPKTSGHRNAQCAGAQQLCGKLDSGKLDSGKLDNLQVGGTGIIDDGQIGCGKLDNLVCKWSAQATLAVPNLVLANLSTSPASCWHEAP